MASKAALARPRDSVTTAEQAIPFRGGSEPAMHELRRKRAPTARSLPFLLIADDDVIPKDSFFSQEQDD
jgi:hypothetical protein